MDAPPTLRAVRSWDEAIPERTSDEGALEAMLLSVDDFDGDEEWHMDLVRLVRDRLTITFWYESLYGGEKLKVKWSNRSVEDSPPRDGSV